MATVILGIHSNVAGDSNNFTDGHAWITVTTDNVTQSYGLWPETDIRVGLEGTRFPVASRFYRLTLGQVKNLK